MDGTRSALIVANDRYQDPGLRQLRAPTQDAQALARVLRDPTVGGFMVRVVANEPEWRLRREIATFFAGRGRHDLLVLHLSCHGLKDDSGQLYFATADTELTNLDATAVPADFVNRHMTRSHSRRVVLLLDCCYSGAFARGMLARAGATVDLEERFEGRGRIVLTASSAMEYAFEETELSRGEGRPSLFTRTLVRGLETGEADLDGDGRISVDELYDYVYEEVRKLTPKQTPGRWNFEAQGDLLIAHSPSLRVVPLPPELQEAVEHPLASVRLGAVAELEELATGRHVGLARTARAALQQLADDDSQRVSARARAALRVGGPLPEPVGQSARAPAIPRTTVPPAAPEAADQAARAPQRPTTPTARRPSRASATPARPTPRRPPATSMGRRRRPLVLLVAGVLVVALVAAAGSLLDRSRTVAAGQRFSASAPWRLKVAGTSCSAVLVSAASRGGQRSGWGSDYSLQIRESGEFVLGELTPGCRAAVVAGAGRAVSLPFVIKHGMGGDSPPFSSPGSFEVQVDGTSCRTSVHKASDGSELTDLDGSGNWTVSHTGEFWVSADARCVTTVSPS
jgi:hypothetical protein